MRTLCMVIPSLQAGGMERVMSELAGYFCGKDNLEVHLVLYGILPEIFYSVPENLIIHQPRAKFNNNFRRIHAVKRLLYLRRTVRMIKPDSVLSFGELWNSFVLLALLGLPFPVYLSDRCSPETRFSSFHSLLRMYLYPRAKGIIAQTEVARDLYLSRNQHTNVTVIGNPIREIKGSGILKEKKKSVLMVGRLIASKHHDKLIEMFAEVKLPDWNLVIVGYDHLKQQNEERLKALAENLKVGSKVKFMGKRKDLDDIYLSSSVFAFTSSSEGFPNVIGEAMAAGLPVVAFNCIAGPADLIRDNSDGFLIPLFDYEMFQEKLRSLMENVELRERLGENARDHIKKFSTGRIGERFLNFILGI